MISKMFAERVLQIFAAEFVGTACLLYFGCIGMIDLSNKDLLAVRSPIAWGCIVTTIITIFGHISEAHFNPCVTFCAVLKQRISIVLAAVYVVAQCLGAVSGFWLMTLVIPCEIFKDLTESNGFCVTTVIPPFTVWQGFAAEFAGTSLLIYAVCSAWNPVNSNVHSSPVVFGITVAAIIYAIAGVSGAGINPARSFGTAVVNGVWKDQWVYWVSPLIATAITTAMYEIFFKEIIETYQPKVSADVSKNVHL